MEKIMYLILKILLYTTISNIVYKVTECNRNR